MPPKKKSAASKAETLADPVTVPSGSANHYIGSWSFHQDIVSITDISQEIVAAHTAEDRTVTPFPRTNVLIFPMTADEDSEDAEAAGEVAPDVIEVADKMQIEGVSHKVLRAQKENMKTWEIPVPAVATEGVPPAEEAEKKPEEATPAADVANDSAAEPPAATDADVKASEAPETARNPLESVVTTVGADFSVDDVKISRAVDVVGTLPQIVVKPTLPTPPKTEEPAAATDKRSKKKRASVSSRRKSAKQKLTPEELAELARKKEEEEAEFLKQTEEAIALAASQEEYLMTFAHPSRWAHVTIANVTFAGPVVVRRAHVVFQNCRFAASSAGKPQLTVSQYCTVECVKCTFDVPGRCGVYVFPAAAVTLRKCLFTGISQATLAGLGGSEGSRLAGVPRGPSSQGARESSDNDDNAAAGEGFATSPSASATGEPSTAEDLQQASAEVRATRGESVGLQVDSAKVTVAECRFVFLGSGVVLHSSRGVPSVAARGGKSAPLSEANASMVVQRCDFNVLYSTAIVLDAHDALVRRNTVADCEYYALDCRGSACRNASVEGNTFGHRAVVRIREKAHAMLMNNTFQSIPVNDNSNENPCMEAVY